MDRALSFRRSLAGRLLQIAALSVSPIVFVATGCNNGIETSGQGGSGQGGGGKGGGSTLSGVPCCDPPDDGGSVTEACFPPPQGGAGGAGGSGGAGGAGNAGDGGGNATTCPSQEQASMYLPCGGAVKSAATFKNGECCYDVYAYGCASGRPFLVGGEARAATSRRAEPGHNRAAADRGWTEDGLPIPSVNGLSQDDRAHLARAWTRDGLLEHASVASFGRFALELMAVGAPADLIELAHRAALDEIRHAKLCLALAGAYAGEAIEPSAFPFGGRVDVTNDLADLAVRAVKEGCIGETLAAIQAAEQHAQATDPAVCAVLAAIAEDESRHAELAWRAVAWACREGGARVRSAVAEAFEAAFAGLSSTDVDEGEDDTADAALPLKAHGLLGESARRALAALAVEEIVRPSARALLSVEAYRPTTPRTEESFAK